MVKVSLLPAAENDLLDHTGYYEQQSGTMLGDRFLTACEEGFARLTAFPESGTALRFRHPRLHSIRFIPVPGFENTLIFYTFRDERVRIVRVLHGKRDFETMLEEE